nr:LamG-like jellyroll fold domain-containing protein [uncultured Draconibacterium sp.]
MWDFNKSVKRFVGRKLNVKRDTRYLFLMFFVLLVNVSNATVYYVSASGNDANTGTSENQAWKTLSKVSSTSFSPGDQILFKRGDEWSGTITVTSSGSAGSPIIYGAYGSGEKPKIYGSEEITGWTQHSGNIYKASFNSSINQVFADNLKMNVARYPNEGYLDISSVQSSTQFTSNTLKSGINYEGATWFGRTRAWTAASQIVTSSSSQTITLDGAPRYDLNVGEGFFLMNKLEFLDSPGEWYYDDVNNIVYLWMNDSDSPLNYKIRGSVYSNGITINSKSYVNVTDLDLLQHSSKGISLSSTNHVSIDNNDISYPDGYGIYDVSESKYMIITNNSITGANHYGMNIRINYSTITDNDISKIALFENIGISGTGNDNYGGGIYIAGAEGNNIVRYNRIAETAYHGIYFSKPKNLVEYNFINHACMWKGDGGGIYGAWSNHSLPGTIGTVVRYNIVLNVHGPKEGYTSNVSYGEGIYVDEAAEGVTVENNTVAHCSNSGIFLHDNANSVVKGNTVLNARYGVLISGEHGTNTIDGNIIYVLNEDQDNYKPNQMLVRRSSSTKSVFNNNRYINHYNSLTIFDYNTSYYDFGTWKSKTGQDSNSTIDVSPMGTNETEVLFYNDTKETKTISLGNNIYRNIDGNNVSGNLTLEPFTSIILIKTATTGSSNQKPEINDQSFGIIGDKAKDEFIAQVVASDPDLDQMLTYEITGGNEDGLFYIDATNGVIYAATTIYETSDRTVDLVVTVTDNATEPVSASAIITINLTGVVDSTPPIVGETPSITSFTIPSSSSSLTVPVTSFTVDGDAIGYLLSTSSEEPTDGSNWIMSVPTSYVFSESGTHTLYAWVKDAEANVSSFASATTTITLEVESSYSEYRFEETSGTTTIDSKGGNDGTIFNEELRVEGVKGQGLQFTGNGYVSMGQCFGGNVIDGVTMSVWIKPTSTSGNHQGIIMHGGPNDDTFALYINPETKAIAFKTTATTSEWSTVEGINELWDGQWHHVVVTYNGTEKMIFLDAEEIFTVSASGNIESGEGYNLYIGAGRDFETPTLKYEGYLDEVRVYNYGLNSSEVDEIYNSVVSYNDTVYATEEISICEGESYNDWTSAGEYQRVLQSITGGDSIVTTYLTVNPVYEIIENIVIQAGEDYNGWTASGEYVRTLSTKMGCDSTITTILSVEEKPIYTTEEISICEGESYNDWTSAGEYQRVLQSITGGDSIVNTYLTVNPVYEIIENIVIQAGEDYNGWTASGEYVRTLSTKMGCDSTITTILSVEEKSAHEPDPIYTTEEISICEGESYNDLTSAGEYERVLQSTTGGDSIVTTYLTVNPVYNLVENIVIPAGEDYNGWTTSGEYVRNFTTVLGCDSTITTMLIVEEDARHFVPVWYGENGQNHMTFVVTEALVDNAKLGIGDEIAVFDNDICVGSVVLTSSIDIDDENSYVFISASQETGDLNGFTDGNEVIFKIWDSKEQVEKVANNVIYHDDLPEWIISGKFESKGTSVVEIGYIYEEPIVTQTIQLEQGWNIFSTAVVPDDPNMEVIHSVLVDNKDLFKVQNEEGKTYEKIRSAWINNIGDIKQTEGYRIRVKSACNIDITGTQVSLPMNINLKAGSNLISFSYDGSVDAMQVIQPLIDAGALEKVQDQKGNSIEYWGAEIGWLNGIGNFIVGQGYQVQVNSDVVLTIGDMYEKSVSINEYPETVHFQPEFQGNGSNHMNINLFGFDESHLTIGDEIAAYDGDICVGATTITASNFGEKAVSINASSTDKGESNGFIEDNNIELKFWDSESNEVTDFNLSVVNGELTYSMHSSIFIKFEDQLLDGENESFSIDMYPNPAINNVNVRFSQIPESDAQLLLLDMNGKQLQSRQVQSTLETLDISSYPTGIYFIKTIVGDFIKTNKLIKN